MAVIIHHTDADGWLGAAVCAKYLKENYDEEIKFIPFSYSSIDISKINRGERVICVDTSLNNNDEALKQWEDVFNQSMNVVFIDHHQSTIDAVKERPDFFSKHNVDAFVSTERSGCYLAYIKFFCNGDLNTSYLDIPDVVEIVDDFDRFILKIENSKIFVKSLDMYDCDPSTKEGLEFWLELLDNNYFGEVEGKMTRIGEMYMKGQQSQWEKLRKGGLYISVIQDKDGNEHEVAVLNADGYSDMFGEHYEKFDACCLWNMTKEGKYSYSLYSHDNKFNCKEFAERYGGGGHPGASGFTIDQLLFLPV